MNRPLIMLAACLIAAMAAVTAHAGESADPTGEAHEIVSFKLTSENGLPDNNIRNISQDSLGYLLLSGRYTSFRYDGYTCQLLTDEERKAITRSRVSTGNRAGNAWEDNLGNAVRLDHSGRLEYTDRLTGEVHSFPVVPPRLFMLTQNLKCHVITDRRGLIWVSTNGNGVTVYNPLRHTWRHISAEDEHPLITTNSVVAMMEDRDGNIWVSGENHGMACLKLRNPGYEVVNTGLASNGREDRVRMLCKLDDGRILVANTEGHLGISTDGLRSFQRMETDGKNYISACIDSDGRLWLGSRDDGLFIEGRHYSRGRVDCILRDNKGRMWTCGLDGPLKLVSFSGGQYSEQEFFPEKGTLRPRTLMQDSRGDIWMGSQRGLFVFNPDELLQSSTAGSAFYKVTDRSVMCLHESAKGDVWVGTAGQGVMVIDGKSSAITSIGNRDGLANDIVQSITEDSQRRICVATEDGCSFIDQTTGRIQNLYFTRNRLRNIFGERCALKLADGRMAFGTYDGIVIADSMEEASGKPAHTLLVTSIEVNGIPAGLNEVDRLAAAEGTEEAMTLSYEQNSLTFSFSSLNYGEQKQTTYRCRLEGYDAEWVNLGHQHTATYKHLPPGRYTLHVSCTEGGQAADSTLALGLRILPPWWATWWAVLIYLLLAVGVGIIAYRTIRHINRLRHAVAVEKELTAYKLKFFTNISHEFRTPLTIIQGSMEKLGGQHEVPPAMRAPLDNMRRGVDRLLRLVNQLMEFRRMQNNHLQLSLEETEVVAFVREITAAFHDLAENRGMTLTFLPAMKSLTLYMDRGFMDKAIYNLLSNAFKYTPDGGSVTVRIRQERSMLNILVEDTGMGVPPELRERIFDRFSRAQIGRDSLGIGLDLSAELIRTHHGTIRCDANPKGGSIFTIAIPTDREAYEEKDFIIPELVAPQSQGKKAEMPPTMPPFTPAAPTGTAVNLAPLNTYRILVVEDDEELAAYLRQELGHYFVTDTAANGIEALEKMGQQMPDLVVTDMMMPVMNGCQLLMRLRADRRTAHLPVIMLTAEGTPDSHLQGLEAGADAYLTKPFSMPLLLLQCRNLLQRTRTKGGNPEQHDHHTALPGVILEERDKKLIEQLRTFVDSHLVSTDLKVDSFAERMGYGRTTFYNKLKSLTGQTPNDYIKERRLLRAAELLRDDRVTVAEVAWQVGMGTPQYLSTCFKKRFGLTPSQYQKGECKEK